METENDPIPQREQQRRWKWIYFNVCTNLLITPPYEVFADLRFFVFNKTENKYYTIQYVDSKLFNTIRTVWGLAQVLPLDTFNDPNNGYIFGGDQCEFGVDVIVSTPPTNWEIHSLHEELSQPKFSWTVKNFSALKENVKESCNFSMGGRKWVLKLYPKGNVASVEGKWLSLYLHLAQCEKLRESEKIFVQAQLRILDPRGSNHFTNNVIASWHNSSNLGWGFQKFMSLAEPPKAYLDKDTLNVEIEFEVVSEAEYSSSMI
ncbi:PREDICTED: ubiquitin carboxyl-terminal hydrolase 12-like [Camelina sativa]|uniref:Ubiquitin carboxyl-terminal hydrolase 12-like n=1 Tax=Camelina sativa TaxID=90675 RepID=A0ABM1QZS0_CAMSA|nr:PREDICTED: ubiquitin carboxyl-terminal hydrolase 12-like [Camelina sativa]